MQAADCVGRGLFALVQIIAFEENPINPVVSLKWITLAADRLGG
jgi:hypothetical protein